MSARLSLGDTFWIGSFGTALVFIPLGVVSALVGQLFFSRGLLLVVPGVWSAFMTLFHAALLTAVLRTAWRTPQVGGWRWVAVLVVLLNVVALALSTYLFWFGAGTRFP